MMKRGQTLIEVLIAAAVIAMTLTAMVAVVTIALARNREAKERVVAARLAQEVSENMRVYRDTNGWNAFMAWISGYGTSPYAGCVASANLINNITAGGDYSILQNKVTSGSSCGDISQGNTTFRRGVLVTYTTTSPEKVEYRVLIDWSKTGGAPMHLDLTGVLYEQ
jgi:Tfp pilus assembly protein PilV